MRRIGSRSLLLSVSACTLAARAQIARTYRVAMLKPFSTEEGGPIARHFLAGQMRELGYVEGRNLSLICARATATGREGPALAEESGCASSPMVLVSDSNAVQILREKTASILSSEATTDPVGDGVAPELVHVPGLNVTGVAQP